ncbi:AAA family ATPase [Bacillus tropicus]|uniref:AAA family ATPase n=1 Tax=Bacillus tropicus TaxID=2026188 RepID=A0ABD7ZP26_9BACI|nr:AAA family ATPase [Bacillus tropicus]WMY13509.1 AAA family ATPase [Bacillus tropicus]
MPRNTVYTYSKKHFNKMYEDKEKQGVIVVSIAQIPNKSQLDQYIEDGFKVEIDLTSAVSLLMVNEESLYQFELYLNTLLGEDTTFIIEENYAEKVLNLFGFIFGKTEAVSLYTTIVSEEVNENSNIKKKEGVAINKVTNLKNDEIEQLYNHLNTNIVGHSDFKKIFIDKVKSFSVFNSIGEHKILSVFLLGPSGVGKTEFAKEIHKFFMGNAPLVKINFGNYSSQDSLNSLIGSPRGYIGSDDGELTRKLQKSDVGIILIDEFEKADKKVFNFFLELLEEGNFTNSLGDVFDLNGYVIVFTSNLNRKSFGEKLPPELRSRFDIKSEFLSLSLEDKEYYLSLKLQQLISKLNIEDKESLMQEIEQATQNTLSRLNNLREINRVLRDEITKRVLN